MKVWHVLQVSKNALMEVIKLRHSIKILSQLEIIEALNCPNLTLSNSDFMELNWKLLPARLDCSMEGEILEEQRISNNEMKSVCTENQGLYL